MVFISGWHIDGFGIFHDYAVRDLQPGFTVFYGPNESGKSTLLGFVRTVLFGFRRADSPQHYPPLAGGRHGGRLFLGGPAGEHTIERWITARSRPRIVLPDGSEGSEADLASLLGNADQTVFESVFAFSLSELQDFRSLDKQGITERIVAAPVVGAGVPIHEVLDRLDERVAGFRSGRRAARIPACLRELSEAEAALAEARRAALDYPALLQAELRAEGARRDIEQKEKAARLHLSRVEKLIAAWPLRQEELDAEAGLAALPPCPQLDELLPQAAELSATAALQRQRLQDLPLSDQKVKDLAAAAARSLAELGPEWNEEALASLPGSLPARDELRRQGEAAEQAAADLQRGRDALRSAEEQRDFAREERERLAATLPAEEPAPAAVLDELAEAAARLRVDLPALQAEPAHPGWRLPAASLGAALVLVGLAAWSLAGGRAVAGGLALAGAALAALVSWSLLRRPASGTSALRARVQADLQALGLPDPPTETDVEAARSALHRRREERRAYEQALTELASRDARLRELQAGADATARRVSELAEIERARSDDWRTCCARHALPSGLSVDGAVDFLHGVRTAREHLDATAEARRLLSGLRAELEKWETQARLLVRSAGEAPPDGGEALVAALLATCERLQERARLREVAEKARSGVVRTLGADADALAAELETGEQAVWEQERAGQQLALEQLRHDLEEAIENVHAARSRRSALEESADVARLDANRQEILARLAGLTNEWREAALAAALVRETLERYTAAHQPAVMAGASRLFALVTEGRYQQVLRDAALGNVMVREPGGARRAVEHLSRGTAEELYLCLRLALADEFATLGRDLPLVMDDVLVNFDPQRARAMCRVLADTADRHQVLLFTCHPATRDMLLEALGGAGRVVELPLAPAAREQAGLTTGV